MSENCNVLARKKAGESVLEAILRSRGIENTKEYFNPQNNELTDPYVFSDMQKAVEIIKSAIIAGDKILVWGDFDADGVTSTSILTKTLDALGANYAYFLPDRAKLGHGLNLKELLYQKSKGNLKVLITVDCGISSVKEITLLKSMGVKTILTDHHEPPEIMPPADCIINPIAKNSLKEDLPVETIKKVSVMSGAGVALKLGFALLGDNFEEVKKQILCLSAVGTIADVVPLLGENRIIAAKGLVEINEDKHIGIKKLFEKQKFDRKITSEDIAFVLSPRINAAGRLDSPNLSIKLLIEDDPLALDMTIEKLDMLNKVRQSLCDSTFEEALSMLKKQDNAIVLFKEDWHLGVIGIVASRLVDKFNLPVFLITTDESGVYRCSIRGSKCVNIADVLKSLEDCFIGFGGHTFAGGFSADPSKIDIQALSKKINEAVSNLKCCDTMENTANADIEITGTDLTPELLKDLEKMEPTGACNAKPCFLFKKAKLISKKTIGKDLNHTSFSVVKDLKTFNCIYWKRKVLGIDEGSDIDFIFRPEISMFNDELRLQLVVDSILNDKIHNSSTLPVKIFDHRQKTGIIDRIDEYVGSKKGLVKVWAGTAATRGFLAKYSGIAENMFDETVTKEKVIMLFDCPPTLETFRELMKAAEPEAVHFMNYKYSKNPDEYISLVCGMIKYAMSTKGSRVDVKTLAERSGLDELCVQTILELLENAGSVKIEEVDKIAYLKPARLDLMRKDRAYQIFTDEFNKIVNFKDYIKTAGIDTLEELCKV